MAIMFAPKGTDYILLPVYLSLPVKLQTPPTAAPVFTILRRQYKYAGSNTPPPMQILDV
jgi:hypothetical protein